jgi:hypothetical protein
LGISVENDHATYCQFRENHIPFEDPLPARPSDGRVVVKSLTLFEYDEDKERFEAKPGKISKAKSAKPQPKT